MTSYSPGCVVAQILIRNYLYHIQNNPDGQSYWPISAQQCWHHVCIILLWSCPIFYSKTGIYFQPTTNITAFQHLRLHRRTGWPHLKNDVCKFRTNHLEIIKVYRGKLNMMPPIFAHIWWHFAYYGDTVVHLVAFYKSMSCGIDHQRLDLYLKWSNSQCYSYLWKLCPRRWMFCNPPVTWSRWWKNKWWCNDLWDIRNIFDNTVGHLMFLL